MRIRISEKTAHDYRKAQALRSFLIRDSLAGRLSSLTHFND